MVERLTFDGSRTFLVASLRESSDVLEQFPVAPFVAMLPAEDDDPGRLMALVRDLVTAGCVELSCVGPGAEDLHDQVDHLLEDSGALSVVTTWHRDVAEGCEHFLRVAGGRPPSAVALVGDRQGVVASLRLVVEAH